MIRISFCTITHVRRIGEHGGAEEGGECPIFDREYSLATLPDFFRGG